VTGADQPSTGPPPQPSLGESINEGVEFLRPEPPHQPLDIQDVVQGDARLLDDQVRRLGGLILPAADCASG
jgi:hypothetical protein